MVNQNLIQQEEVVFTSASLTLGMAASGQIVPPRYVVCEPTGAMTITLPLSTPTLPSQTSGVGGSPVPGFGPGFAITFFNNSAQTITISAAAGDTLLNGINLTAANQSVTYFSVPTENKWYAMAGATSANTSTQSISIPSFGATATSFTAYVADGPAIVTADEFIFGTASSSGTLQVEKATGTTAVSSGTNILTGTVSLAGAANTIVKGTLVATTATLTLAATDRLNIILAGTLTSLANATGTISIRRL